MIAEGIVVCGLIVFNVVLQAPANAFVLAVRLVGRPRDVVFKVLSSVVVHHLVSWNQQGALRFFLLVAEAHVVRANFIGNVSLRSDDSKIGR